MSAWQEYKKKLGESRPWDIVNTQNHVDEAIARARMDICEVCPRLTKTTKQCKECGCFMTIKTRLKLAECPIGKWGKEN